MSKPLIAIVFIPLLLLSAQLLAQQEKPPYDLENPSNVFRLPDYLEEVSGLTYYAPNQLAMHNDENGRMYVFDLEKKSIVHRVRFNGDGDFEGIERVGKHIYVTKSNGRLYRFNVDIEGVVEEIKTPFSKDNNIEGLGYHPKTNTLLFALKNEGDVEKVKVSGRAIYGYDLQKEEFINLPLYSLSHKELERVVGDDFSFHPSGVAVHPITFEIYVISAQKRALLIFGEDGKPKNLTHLKRSLFPQPEGIAFTPNGDLYISNEMDGDGGSLLEFRMNK